MSLTLEAEQQLKAVNLITLFTEHQGNYDFIQASFPANATIRRDDVAKALLPILEVNEQLNAKLAINKLKQKYWVSDFTDLIIDRVWESLDK